MLWFTLYVYFNFTGQNEIHIGMGFIIDKPIQFSPLVYTVGNLILHGGAVDGNYGTIIIFCLHTAGVHVESTAYNSFHNSLLIVRS